MKILIAAISLFLIPASTLAEDVSEQLNRVELYRLTHSATSVTSVNNLSETNYVNVQISYDYPGGHDMRITYHSWPNFFVNLHHGEGNQESSGYAFTPAGWSICKIKLGEYYIDPQATFTMSLQGPADHWAYYTAVTGGGNYISFDVSFEVYRSDHMPGDCYGSNRPSFECGKQTKAGERDCYADMPGAVVGPKIPAPP